MKQIIPCNVEMYAVYDLDDGTRHKEQVLAFGFNEQGYVIPLVFDTYGGIEEARCNNLSHYEFPDQKPEPLDRIAEALEGIHNTLGQLNDTLGTAASSLETLEELRECISDTPRGKLLCITGNVSTYEL